MHTCWKELESSQCWKELESSQCTPACLFSPVLVLAGLVAILSKGFFLPF